MMRYAQKNTFRYGIVGILATAVIVLIVMNASSLTNAFTSREYHAMVADAAGLRVGDPVVLMGTKVGSVSGIDLDGADVRVSFKITDSSAHLGAASRARIATATVLGSRNLTVESLGSGTLAEGATIGLNRTSVPYDLTEVLGDVTTSTGALDTAQLNSSLRAVNDVLRQTPEELGGAVEGLGRLSATIASRDDQLRGLLEHAQQVTSVLAERSDKLNVLLLGSDQILGELDSRRSTVDSLFANVAALSESLRNLVRDNQSQLGPTLARVNSVLEILRKNRDNISESIIALGPYATELGEAIASGPFFNSYIANLLPGQLLEPFLRDIVNNNPLPQRKSASPTNPAPATATSSAPTNSPSHAPTTATTPR